MKILDILPVKGSLGAEQFRSRYRGMPEEYQFHILATGDVEYDGEEFANAKLYVQPPAAPWTRWRMIRRAMSMAIRAVRVARREKVDIVISYDPLTLGVIALLAKLFSGAKLVIEVNGHIRNAEASAIAKGGAGWFKRTLFNTVGSITLAMADAVKLLNEKQYEEWRSILARKPVAVFHNFVPTSRFRDTGEDEHFVYCLGHPFHVKGVDILLDAFAKISSEFPDYRLIVMGHCRQPALRRWKERAAGIERAEFRAPVPEVEVIGYLSRCSMLVNPSRSEGMGRVFIEAMASGKACIGTTVGGIPNVIVDGETGFLVAPEDTDDLAAKLRLLLADPNLRGRMGKAGRRRTETVLSEKSYVQCYRAMIEFVAKGEKDRNGIIFNGFKERIGERGAR